MLTDMNTEPRLGRSTGSQVALLSTTGFTLDGEALERSAQLHKVTPEPVPFSIDFAATHTAEQIKSFCIPAQHGYGVPGDPQGGSLLHSNDEMAARAVLAIWHGPSTK